MHVKAGVAIEPSGDRGMFMGGVIVGDDVDGEIARGLRIDGFEKGQPLLMAMTRGQAGDQLALEIIERGKQGQRDMAHVIVGLGATMADPQRQTRLRALQSWHCDFSSQHSTSALSGGLRRHLHGIIEALWHRRPAK